MYATADTQLDRILSLTEKCPEPYRVRCFEILLQGYVDSVLGRGGGAREPGRGEPAREAPGRASGGPDGDTPPPNVEDEPQIPAALLGRFRTTAKRLNVSVEALERLFDFSADPIDFHALHVPGKGNADKTRKVALLVAARSYLTTGAWVADRKEVKAQCVDQNCYDMSNFAQFLRQGAGKVFKSVDVGDRIELNGAGVKEAEALLAALATAEE